MFDLFTIALFQLATLVGFPTEQSPANDQTPAATEVGSGGWGHDIQSNSTPTNAEVGSGGWGHD